MRIKFFTACNFAVLFSVLAGCDLATDTTSSNAGSPSALTDTQKPSRFARCAGSYEPEKCEQQERDLADEEPVQAAARRAALEDARQKNMALANASAPKEDNAQLVVGVGQTKWWSANGSFSKCIPSEGPAARLDNFVGTRDTPFTRDYRRGDGTLWKVEVINPDHTTGNEEVWTYYDNQQTCLAEQVNATRALADRYR